MKRTTVKDIAREAGVSLSTVNKALTDKKGISAEMKQRILDVAKKLDYKANPLAGTLARSAVRIGIITPDDWEDYYNDIYDGISHETKRLVNWKIESTVLKYSVNPVITENQALSCFEQMHQNGIEAVIFCHGNYSSYSEAITFAQENNIKVICIGIGILSHEFFSTIEVDAHRCGRIAADYLEQLLPSCSETAIVIGNKSILPHHEKECGFLERIAETNKLSVLPVIETNDNDEAAYRKVQTLLQEKAVAGIYVATSAVDGVCRAVCDSGLCEKVRIIATDLSEECKKHLLNRTVKAAIYQNTFMQGIAAVRMFFEYYTAGKLPPKEFCVAPVLFTKESLMPENQKILLTEKI